MKMSMLNQPNIPVMTTDDWQDVAPASLEALQVYLPWSERLAFLMTSTARLLLKDVS